MDFFNDFPLHKNNKLPTPSSSRWGAGFWHPVGDDEQFLVVGMNSMAHLLRLTEDEKRRNCGVNLLGGEFDFKYFFLGGGFKYFYFHPYLGKTPILTNIFQMG